MQTEKCPIHVLGRRENTFTWNSINDGILEKMAVCDINIIANMYKYTRYP